MTVARRSEWVRAEAGNGRLDGSRTSSSEALGVARNAEAVHWFVSCAAPEAALWVLGSVGVVGDSEWGDAAERLALHCSASDLFSRARS